ncbi:MAG: DUF2169 domain-containing protein [Polyangiaceae bacterium]|nr:DUF2169 domain-containing protein [Polyangiaceae bacterium]
MFVRNRTEHKATLTRGHVSDTLSVATVVVVSTYRIDERGALHVDSNRKAAPTDAPTTEHYALWHEVSVTASGMVYGPARPPFVVAVSLRVGDVLRRVAVFGDRRWERAFGGDLVPSDPAPFDALPLAFDRAYGGKFDMPPGPDPLTGFPHPGGTMAFAKNPEGRGFYLDAASAEDGLLPNIELPEKLVQKWDDRPEPAGFAPCPELVALRMTDDFLLRMTGLRPESPPPEWTPATFAPHMPVVAMRAIHHAPGRLIFPTVPAGTRIELTGLGRKPLRFDVPGPPAKVVTASSNAPNAPTGSPLRSELRSIHIDADERHVLFAHGYTMTYRRDFAPEWLLVLPSPTPS